jgi:hypothetical protein
VELFQDEKGPASRLEDKFSVVSVGFVLTTFERTSSKCVFPISNWLFWRFLHVPHAFIRLIFLFRLQLTKMRTSCMPNSGTTDQATGTPFVYFSHWECHVSWL